VASGGVRLNGTALAAGDGAAVEDEAAVELTGVGESEVLLFDLGG
jgi:quercetin 2,3-dioxygenase